MFRSHGSRMVVGTRPDPFRSGNCCVQRVSNSTHYADFSGGQLARGVAGVRRRFGRDHLGHRRRRHDRVGSEDDGRHDDRQRRRIERLGDR